MITFNMTSDANTLDVCYKELNGLDKNPKPAGFIRKDGDLWFPYRDNIVCGDGGENPVDVAKQIFPDYEDRARRSLVRAICELEDKIANDSNSILNLARGKMLDGLRARLASGEF